MSVIKNLIFDLGGVVVDLDRSKAVSIFKDLGVANADEMLDAYHQNGIFLKAENGEVTADEFVAEISKMVGKQITYEDAYRGWTGFVKDVNEEKLAYLRSLKERKYRVLALSNTNPFFMEWARSRNFSRSGHNINHYFDKVYASYELKMVKPHVEIFNYVINDSNIVPQETLFLDDGINNINTGKEVGFKTIMPLNGEDWREKVEELL